jgi:hypothetical protein
VAAEDFRTVEVAAIGDGFELIRLQYCSCLLSHIGELCCHFVRNDQMMLGVDRDRTL